MEIRIYCVVTLFCNVVTLMQEQIKINFSRKVISSGKVLSFTSLLFMILLFSSPYTSMINNVSPFALGADITVSNQNALKSAIISAPTGLESTFVIALNADIVLSESLVIPTNKNITLTSTGDKFFKLIGTTDIHYGFMTTVIVEDRGFLIIDGIAVTHVTDDSGIGVIIDSGGTLVMLEGEIFGNSGGVYNHEGSFNLFGGTIYGNADQQYGGGVSIYRGSFMMFGGEISGNTAWNSGGGVHNDEGIFEMYGGVIANNTATQFNGGGVDNNYGTFRLHDGVIANNTAGQYGGGVISAGSFEMLGGTIFNNIAKDDGRGGGGGVFNSGQFSLTGGAIVNNTASMWGGGVLNAGSMFDVCDFSLSGGVIANNTALTGGGVYNINGRFNVYGGKISSNTAYEGGGVTNYLDSTFSLFEGGVIANNTANWIGGGVYNRGTFSLTGGIISNNTAVYGGGVSILVMTNISTMERGVIANNTASINGGGVYIAFNDLNKLFISNGMVFSNNYASTAYNRNPAHDELYRTQIGNNVVWSEPFTQGYNNYDVSYTAGTLAYVVLVRDSYAPTTGKGSYPAGTVITINAGTRNGYTFSSWTVNSGGVSLSNSASATFTMPANNVVITANWTPTTDGGGSGGSSGSGSSNKPSPNTPAPSEPTPSNPTPSETTPPTPTNPEIIVDPPTSNGVLWIIVAIVLIVLASLTVGVILQKRGKN